MDLLVPIQGIIANLFTYNDSIYFSSDINGRDNLYVLDPRSAKVFLLTDNSIGIQQFSIKYQEVVYNYVPPEVYRTFGFPGADDLGNMFQYKRDFEASYCAPRDIALSRALNPKQQSFSEWAKAKKDRIPIA